MLIGRVDGDELDVGEDVVEHGDREIGRWYAGHRREIILFERSSSIACVIDCDCSRRQVQVSLMRLIELVSE